MPGGEDGGVGDHHVEVRDEGAQLELLEVALFFGFWWFGVCRSGLGWVVGGWR